MVTISVVHNLVSDMEGLFQIRYAVYHVTPLIFIAYALFTLLVRE